MNLTDNRLFAQFARRDQSSLQKLSKQTKLSARQILGGPGSSDRTVYFLTSSSVALVVRDGAKPGLALGLIGREGAVGVHFALGLAPGIFTLLVQSPGMAYSIDGDALEALAAKRPQLLFALSKYVWTVAQDVASHAAFAQSSDVKPRLARWILASYHRSNQQELTLTQLHLAQMLGVRRSSITLAAIELKAAGLVEYNRGKLVVLDPRGLEVAANALSSSQP